MEALKAEIARKRKALEDSKLMVRLFPNIKLVAS
jgi:hypothetical protein